LRTPGRLHAWLCYDYLDREHRIVYGLNLVLEP
jgi:hypothetical protein